MKLIYLHLSQALRHMRRNYLQTFLSLVGLVIGLSSFAFGLNWFWYETHYESFRPDYRNIHMVCNHSQGQQWNNFSQPYPMHEFMRDSIPGVTNVAILGNAPVENIFDMNDRNLFAHNYDIGVANPGFIKLMGVKLLYGDAETALNRIDGIIVTQRMAQEIFQRENVVGESLKIKQNSTVRIFTITGVSENRYQQTAITFDGLISLDNIPENLRNNWYNYSPQIFFKARNIHEVDQRLRARLVNDKSIFFATPLTQRRAVNGIWEYLAYPVCALAVSFLLLVSALFNYIAILTAQFIGRFREYKLRIGLGSTFTNNLLWLYSEVCIMCILMILGSGMLLDTISVWSDMEEINSTLFRTYACLVPICSILLFFAALYPSFYLRHIYFRAYKGKKQVKSGKAGMLFVQILVCTLFIFVFINAYRQFHFMTHANLGFNYERVIRLFTRDAPFDPPLIESILSELRSHQGGCIEDVVLSPSSIFQSRQYQGSSLSWKEGDEVVRTVAIQVPPQVFHFFGIRPLSGKIYENEETAGTDRILLNKDAAELIHYTPDIRTTLLNYGKPVEVTGVVNFYTRSFHNKESTPVIYHYTDKEVNSYNHEVMFIRYRIGQYAEALQLIKDVLKKRQIPPEGLELSNMDTYITDFYKQEAHMLKILSIMFTGSILITLLGVLSQISYTLTHHRKFIAVRRVFGATYIDLCRKYLRDYILLTCIACIIILPVGYFLITQWLQSYRSPVSVGLFECLWIGGLLVVVVSSVILIRLWRALYENPSRVIKGE